MRNAVVSSLALAALLGCSKPWVPPTDYEDLATRDPAKEAAAAVERGNLFLYGVTGLTVAVPGTKDPNDLDDDYCWREAGLVRVIPGTSDAIESDAHLEYNEQAFVYAKRFNARVISESQDLQAHKCAI